jgi:hypothetical protein
MRNRKDPFAALRAMGVTMSVAERSTPPVRPSKRREATSKAVVVAVRRALQDYQGLSAASMACALVPELQDYADGLCGGFGLGSYPCDPADFGRCRRIVALVPNGLERVREVAAAFPQSRGWARLAPAWAELESLWTEEVTRPDGRMPKLYARMQELTR